MQALEALGLATVECGQALFNSGQQLAGAFGEGLFERGGFGVGVVLIGEGGETFGQRFE